MKAFPKSLLVLGLIALVAVVFPDLALLALMSIIGAPIGIVLIAAPPLFTIVLIAWLIHRKLQLNKTPRGGAIALALALCILAVPAFVLNLFLNAPSALCLTGDHDNLALPLQAKTIAVRARQMHDRGISLCDGFCLHALLTGTADEVILFDKEDSATPPEPASVGHSFRLERRAECPMVIFRPGAHQLDLTAQPGRNFSDRADPVELMRLRISQGVCLIEGSAPLAHADFVLSVGLIHAGKSGNSAGLNPFADTANVFRTTVHQRAANEFHEVYRLTRIKAAWLGPLLLPVLVDGPGLSIKTGFWRRGHLVNIPNRYHDGIGWPEFLTETLKLDLALDAAVIRRMQREQMQAVLAAHRPPTKDEWEAFVSYGHNLWMRPTLHEDSDVAIVLDVLEHPDFPVPPRLWSIGNRIARSNDPALQKRFADALFRRLDTAQTWAAGTGDPYLKALEALGGAIGQLPPSAVEGHFDSFARLADNEQRREYAWQAFKAMRAFGDKAVPVYLKLLDGGLAGSLGTNRYQHPYLAGMIGLCLTGSDGATALPRLEELHAKGKLARHGSYRRLLVNTFVRLGGDPEPLFALYAEQHAEQRDKARRLFDHEVRRARSDKPDCGY